MILVTSNNLKLDEKNSCKNISSLSSKTVLNMTESQICPEKLINGLDGDEKESHISDIHIESNCESEMSPICENIISASCDSIVTACNDINTNDSEICNNDETEIVQNLETSTNAETVSTEKSIDEANLSESNSNENDAEDNPSNLLTDLELIKDNKLMEDTLLDTSSENVNLEKMDIESENCLLDNNVLHDQNDNDFSQEINSEISDTAKSLNDSVDIEMRDNTTVTTDNMELDPIETIPEKVLETEPDTKPEAVHETIPETDHETIHETAHKTESETIPKTTSPAQNEVSTEDITEEIPKTPVLENDHMVYIATPDVFKELADGSSENSTNCKENDTTDIINQEISNELEENNENEKNSSIDESTSLDNKNKKNSVIIDTLDLLLSDDENDPKDHKSKKSKVADVNKSKSKELPLTIDEDDDLLLVEDECKRDDKSQNITTNEKLDKIEKKEGQENNSKTFNGNTQPINTAEDNSDISESNKIGTSIDSLLSASSPKALSPDNTLSKDSSESMTTNENQTEINTIMSCVSDLADSDPIIPLNFMKTFKTSLARMTRDDLEEYCVVKIVEGIMKRSDLSKAEAKIEAEMKNADLLRKKIAYLTKQQKDLETVMKSLSIEHKKRQNEILEPIKISRSVGFQVGYNFIKNSKKVMNMSQSKDRNTKSNNKLNASKSSSPSPIPIAKNVSNPKKSPSISQKTSNDESKSTKTDVSNSILKSVLSTNFVNDNGVIKQSSEKRPLDQSIDLTDDEPPAKQIALSNKSKTTTPNNRLQSPPNTPIGNKIMMLNSTPHHNNSGTQKSNSYRLKNPSSIPGLLPKPIRGNHASIQNQNIRFGIPIKTVSNPTPQRINNINVNKHPAPLPTFRNTSWEWSPPKPELKISKVPNGIVLSWTMEADTNKKSNIASYQIYAYQETSAPANTELWKKIGDVKALPLPMACTLTQFMAGYKYFFAVRAVDIYSRVGPFSLPGFILLNHEK